MRDARRPSTYLHGTTVDEQSRLSRLNDLLNSRELTELALAGDELVLDVGAGLGQLTRALAARVRHVVAVERDARQLARAAELAAGDTASVEWRQGDADALPLTAAELGSFDLAHTRFLLEHVPDPLAVVREMVRAVRPGGRVVLVDDDHDVLRHWPERPALTRLWNAYAATFAAVGNDPHVGRKLTSLLHDAGATPARTAVLFFGACAGDPTFQPLVDNLAGVVRTATEQIEAHGLLSRRDIDTGFAAIEDWRRAPDAALWYVCCYAEGRRA